MQTIQSLYHAVNRLARLNQSLNLLTKIENREFDERQRIDFNALIEQQLENLDELIQMSQLKVTTRLKDRFVMDFNPFMAETLLSNLLINAVKHNLVQGYIEIETTSRSITIANSGPPLQYEPQELFARFKKDRPAPDSPGLGLSIVQSICRQKGLNIDYAYARGKHTITIHNYEQR
jgi:signal transduction histidine kinase